MKVIFLLALLVSVTLAANIHGFIDEVDEQAPGTVKTGKLFCLLKPATVSPYSLIIPAQFFCWCLTYKRAN